MFVSRTLLPLLTTFFFLTKTLLLAQTSGWDFIRENNFAAAAPAFEAELRHRPSDIPALVGKMFLAETVQDHDTYERTARQLLATTDQPALLWLFAQMWGDGPENILQRSRFPENLRLPFAIQQADTLFKYRRFAESRALLATVLHGWNWSLAGPFDNPSGSGFVEKTTVDTTAFDATAQFRNAYGTTFGWLRRQLRAPSDPVTFEHLPTSQHLGTYYANTFLTVPTARRTTLRITRGEPIKIWLDDQLLLERPRTANPDLADLEAVTFDLPAGTHRLLVKLSEFPDDFQEAKIKLAFNDLQNDEEATDSDMVPDFQGKNTSLSIGLGRGKSGFVLRFTDPVSGQLMTDLTTDYTGRYTSATAPWNTEFQGFPYPDLFTGGQPYQQYLRAKAWAKLQDFERSEEYFVRQAEQQPTSALIKFLLAKCFALNGKSERAERLLTSLDTTLTPTFAEHYLRLQKIDEQKEETRYVGALERLLEISPTHWPVLSRYLDFLKEKGRREQIQRIVTVFLEKNPAPKWANRLEEYLKDESYKPESFKPKTDRDRERAFKQAEKRLKRTCTIADFRTVLAWQKQHDRHSDALSTYDKWLSVSPYDLDAHYGRARYLFEIGRTEESLTAFRALLEHDPYKTRVHEAIGDILIEQKKDAEALACYRRAQQLQGRTDYSELTEKIEKIENRRQLGGYFTPVSLTEIARDQAWVARYTDEESVISLFSQQLTYLPEQQKIEAQRKVVIHILSEAGAKRWTEADLRLIGQITSAKVLKRDGSVTSPDLGGYGVAVFKNLQAGDIILAEGSAEQFMPDEIPGELLHIGILSWPAPVVRATTELLLPRQQSIYTACNRVDCQYVSRDTGDFRLITWQWRDLPKVEDYEDAAPENYDAYAWLMFGSAPDWQRVSEWYERKTYCRTEPNYEVLDCARQLLRPDMSDEEVVETLHTFITKGVTYSFVPFLNTNYVPKKPGATLSGKVGDCKDVATLMIALLRERGIPAWYTLVSTHSFSDREPRPTMYIFNHAIVAYQLKNKPLQFADLTTDYFPSGVLPDGDCGAWGLVVRPGETALRRLPDHTLDPEVSHIEITAQASVDAEGNLLLDGQMLRSGTAAGNWRETLIPATATDRAKRISQYFGGGVLHHLDVEALEFSNLDSINAPLRTRMRLRAFHQLDRVSNLWIMPLPLPLSTPTHKGLFAAKRYNNLDVDVLFELAPVRETVDLTLPAGYSLAEMPQNQRLSTPFGEYALMFEPIPGGLRIRREVTFRQRFIQHDTFLEFKKFYLAMLDADDALLALKKNGGRS